MTIERNLSPNPACAINATGWVATLAGDWALSTSVDAALPRATGFEGTTSCSIDTPRFLCTAGIDYIVSVSVKALAAQAFTIYLKWYDGATGGLLVQQETAQSVSMTAGQVTRLTFGPITAPANALSGLLKFAGIDPGGAEITALRVSQSTGNATADTAYFDGATAGATWDGTSGSSTSTRRTFIESTILTDTFTKTVTAAPGSKALSDTAILSSTWSVRATGAVVDTFYMTDGFLVASLSFDEARGRVRMNAFTFAPGVTHAVVSRRLPGGRYSVIRGGDVPVVSGAFARIVDDYEYFSGQDSEYLIEGMTDTNVVIQRSTILRSGDNDRTWLKIVANPRFNLRVNLVGWGRFGRKSRSSQFVVQGRSDPVVLSDVHSSRSVSIKLLTRSLSDTDALDIALSSGIPIFLQVPYGHNMPTMYASVEDYTYGEPNAQDSGHTLFEIQLIEVSPPSGAIIGTIETYQTIFNENATYSDLLNAFDTYERMAS